jgi:putative PIN family toxin of toxin-antitoxin system
MSPKIRNRPQIVIDTNVWVAARRSQLGASARLVSQIATGRFDVHISVPLLFEYEEVLMRMRHELNLTRSEIDRLLDGICRIGKAHDISYLWRTHVRDPDDAHVLELAVAAACDYIVTFNLRDFPEAHRFGIEVLRPGTFLKRL